MVFAAIRTGHLENGNPAKRRHWLGRAVWFGEAAVQLVTDAAETYDRRIRLQNQQRQQREHNQHMRVKTETRYHGGHKEQVHATATVFEPTPTSNVSDDEIFDMDYESDEEAFPVQVLLNMVDSMLTSKREKTIEWLQRIAAAGNLNNPVVGLLRNIPSRQRVAQVGTLSKMERMKQRELEAVFQRDVVRRVRKWERSVQNAHRRKDSDTAPTFTSSPGKTSVNTLDEATVFNQRETQTRNTARTDAYQKQEHKPDHNNQTPATAHQPIRLDGHGQRNTRINTVTSHVQHPMENHNQHIPTIVGGQDTPTTGRSARQTNTTTPWLQVNNTDTKEETPSWKMWRRLTPLQRQRHREQRMMGNMTGGAAEPLPITTLGEGQQQAQSISMVLRQLANSTDTPPTCVTLRSAGSEARARWQNDLDDYDYRVWQYRQTHPWYVLTLSKWVDRPHSVERHLRGHARSGRTD